MADSPHAAPAAGALILGMQRQFEIYQLGLAGKKISVPIPLAELERKAAEVLSAQAYDYVAGGASGERKEFPGGFGFDHGARGIPVGAGAGSIHPEREPLGQRKGFRFQVSGFRFQVSGFRFHVSGFRFQVSGWPELCSLGAAESGQRRDDEISYWSAQLVVALTA